MSKFIVILGLLTILMNILLWFSSGKSTIGDILRTVGFTVAFVLYIKFRKKSSE